MIPLVALPEGSLVARENSIIGSATSPFQIIGALLLSVFLAR